ncbi:glycylpeptide N-tetradecanoyltransferase 1-like [Histomonas meleagridis]|uniref:glycylpeptide N-tetradecanoyltransferase 1-like n=1 Tax=Histomonas meleagridis TaxID=135588 RepID=UPI003559986D|nr:glycylpeptide N-tetradecanoyltransferase 1-like [Histomonas meleagridis]KAH0798004.1 glycylpeptide N-tetradecanoyltransferase 1-like [Histomonas meleagridis]
MTEEDEMHKFWSKQPVLRENEEGFDGYIDTSIPVTAPPDHPASLPSGYTWCTIDINDDQQLQEVYKFLSLNYVEASDHRFRFLLPASLIKWALLVPGYIQDWFIGVRTKTGALCGFISGIPIKIRLNEDVQTWCSVNFLCVHARLRSKKLAPVLIFELARRVRLHKVYRAVFSGGDDVPSKAFSQVQYMHRPLNLKKMSASGFYPISKSAMASAQKRFALPKLVHGNIRPFCEADVEGVTNLFKNTSSNYKFDIDFTPELVRYMFMPREETIYSYVIPSSNGPAAFASFYLMKWSVLNESSSTVTEIRAAYIYYTVTNNIDMKSLVADIVNKAVNDAKADIINGFSFTGEGALTAHKFEAGSKCLQYYSYNYAVPNIPTEEMRYIFV